MQVPWAEPQGRFTLLFERFAVEVLLPAPASARLRVAGHRLGDGAEMMGRRWSGAWNGGNWRR